MSAPAIVAPFHTLIISADWPSYQERSDRFLAEFFESVRSLVRQGKHVILIGKVPILAGYDRRCREKALSYPGLACPPVTAAPGGAVASVNARLKEFADQTADVAYFDPTRFLCPRGVCSAMDAHGVPEYYDANHLTIPMSWKLGRIILQREGLPAMFRLSGHRPGGGRAPG